ncbi:serine/threonine protein kinase [Mumia sp. zg.B17]|uniref:serine/threonine-protein kinase n=1 Tax=Mumia sp. zg.B17 TaxID=2855446 RepID=UPI001C6E6C5B|nr:serine/threonine-protein kinase [Mumia sp. zg.B17]MBW9204845.1 serine/threonine protein kinase [Mumia sp. zg.B17]
MGEVFAGRYELLEPIGAGGMGTVWLVHDRRDDHLRAAKLVRQVDASLLLRFIRELSTRIEHPHTVVPRGWAGEDDTVLFTMDVVRGGSVHHLIEDFGALPAPWAACLLDQLLDALEAVHRAGVVHRDVKPANLLLEPTGRGRPYLRLSDFGVAVPLHEPRMTAPAIVLGTRGYRAPESTVGADPLPVQDLYGAGVVLAEMLTGERPEDGRALQSAPPPGVDRRLWDLARALAEPDPARRPPSAARARRMLHDTGLVPPAGAAPGDDGAEIEVFEHVRLHGTDAAPALRTVPLPPTAPEPLPSPSPSPGLPPGLPRPPASTRRPSPLAAFGLLSVGAGGLVIVLAILMLLG